MSLCPNLQRSPRRASFKAARVEDASNDGRLMAADMFRALDCSMEQLESLSSRNAISSMPTVDGQMSVMLGRRVSRKLTRSLSIGGNSKF